MDETSVLREHGERRFKLLLEGEQVGHITYRQNEEVITFVHTFVSEDYSGRGLAARLVAGALADLRSHDEALIPLCPYVQAYLRKHPEDIELVPSDRRADFELD